MDYIFGLCQGRHDIPGVDTYIFGNEVDPLDTEGLRKQAYHAIPKDATSITLYVTGLSVALLAVVDVCFARQISLTAMHYDRNSNSYYRQIVLDYVQCPFCHRPNSRYDYYCPHCGST